MVGTSSRARVGLLSLVIATCGCLATAESTEDEGPAAALENEDDIVGATLATEFPESVLVNMTVGGKLRSACSGAVIAPKVVLTAGHCIFGFDGWEITAPFADHQKVTSTSAAVLDYDVISEFVDPSKHDVGLIFLGTPIHLTEFPKVSAQPVADGTKVVNIGRIDDGILSSSKLFVSKPVRVKRANSMGFPFDYAAALVIQSGDSGGPDIIVNTHTIVGVNSGAGNGTEVLARVDLVMDFITEQVNAHGGF
jgi:hypothetical protein